jgi:hypothetical protein
MDHRQNRPSAPAMLLTAVALALSAMWQQPAWGHETDQFSVPVGREMAEVGPWLNDLMVARVELAVERVNAQIRRAIEQPHTLRTPPRGHGQSGRPQPSRRIDAEALIALCQSPEGIGEAVWRAYGPAVDFIELLETRLHSDDLQRQFPGKVVAWHGPNEGNSIYNGLYFPLDPRTAFRLYHSSTFMAYGVYMGTDKMGHFVDMGYHYFREYRRALAEGLTPDEAMLRANWLGTDGPFSEKGVLGYLTAGAYSNADLVSNYVGALFYRNLTESVWLKGELYPPILESVGPYWRVADHVRNNPMFFERFVSDHYDEALNPSHFQPIIQPTLRQRVAERVPDLLVWYADRYGEEDPRAYFYELMLELSTYYGAEYGHSGKLDELVGIWNSLPERNLARSE